MGHFNNRSIVYLHGYGSSSKGEKPSLLRELFPQNRLLIPDLPLDPLACMNLCEDTLKTASNDTIIVGASLGGFYAYYLAAKYKKDCLLINPVYQPALEAKKLLEAETNLEKKKIILNAANMYLSYRSNLNSLSHPKNCFVALGKKDTIIDPEVSSLHFADAYVKMYEDDHYMLKSFAGIMKEFEDYLEERF
ncbi:hypothetical protein JHD50_03110 [Sulfurimonas sp. MAG313]|nr:YqiA/YcfP family alpha/beta fold hydrolase [Sulfurimonas sp. MAG313]MDF1880301.1 hypothetical protein [Sulfurimonas sp. MAG313]